MIGLLLGGPLDSKTLLSWMERLENLPGVSRWYAVDSPPDLRPLLNDAGWGALPGAGSEKDQALFERALLLNDEEPHGVVGIRGEFASLSRAKVEEAVEAFRAMSPAVLCGVDAAGEETPALRIIGGPQGLRPYPEDDRVLRYPLELRAYDEEPKSEGPGDAGQGRMAFDEAAHREEAETYRDRIKDRIRQPEKVPEELKHLIPDDHQRLKRLSALPWSGKVLDIGCSDGTISLTIAAAGAEVVGIDIAASAIEEAKEQSRTVEPAVRQRCRFLSTSLEAFEAPPGGFTWILAGETLEHLAAGQLRPALDKIRKLLAPGGTLVVTVPNRYPARRCVEQGRARWAWPNHHYFFSLLKLKYELGRYFNQIDFVPLYPGEEPEHSIYLIALARGEA